MGEESVASSISWVCPSCLDKNNYAKLALVGATASCENGHQFDKAKQVYLNLLLPHKKRSKAPGDAETMISARREFLSRGHYQFLMAAMAEQMQRYVTCEPLNALDIGCGEGSYIAYFSKVLPFIRWSGIDVSKPAIKKAAAASKTVNFAVASSSKIPVHESSLELALSVFAPIDHTELKRVLKPGGTFVRVSPGENHFFELKRSIYDSPKPHDAPTSLEGFTVENAQNVKQTVSLDNNALQLLLAMTPLQWRGNENKKQELKRMDHLRITFDFIIQLMRYE